MIHDLLRALIDSPNEAADDVLVEALRIGTPGEQPALLAALLVRKSVRGLGGVVELYEKLPESLQVEVLASIKPLHPAIRECSRSDNPTRRLAAIKLIAQGRQGLLSYLLSENLHSGDEQFSKAAAGAMTALARWIVRSVRELQFGDGIRSEVPRAATNDVVPLIATEPPGSPADRRALYRQIVENRAEIETAIVRAVEMHRGSRQQELVHAAMLLCDSAASASLSILNTAKHGGQGAFLRRVQQTPDAEHVPAFLLAATHAGLRHHFGASFAKIDQAVTLDALLRKTHWLRDQQLRLCMRQVQAGAWCDESILAADLARRPAEHAPAVAQWIAATGLDADAQDARLERVAALCSSDPVSRARILRSLFDRPRDAGQKLLRTLTKDQDERLARMAVREVVRRGASDTESFLLPLINDAPESIRRLLARTVGRTGFDTYWERFDRMDRAMRKNAGRAMLKLLPDATQQLGRRLAAGPVEDRVKAMQIVGELDLVRPLRARLLPLCSHANPRVRSKAVSMLGELGETVTDVLIEKAATDPDARVRANAIEVMEQRGPVRFVPTLTERARSGANRERANAIKALSRMRVAAVHVHLSEMLRDRRPEHRVSALWCLRRIGWWKLLTDVARIAREDDNPRVKRYATSVLQVAVQTLRPDRPSPTTPQPRALPLAA